MKTIHCSGIYRSGTTLVYQIIQKLIEKTTGVILTHGKGDGFRTSDYYITKVHQDWIHRGDQYEDTIYCYRDLRDVLVSFMDKYDYTFDTFVIEEQSSVDFVQWMIGYDRFVRNYKGNILEIRYEDEIFNVPYLVDKISAFIKVSDKYNNDISNEVSIEKNKVFISKLDDVDNKTKFWPKHINDGKVGKWKDKLHTNNLGMLYDNTDLKQWLLERDYDYE